MARFRTNFLTSEGVSPFRRQDMAHQDARFGGAVCIRDGRCHDQTILASSASEEPNSAVLPRSAPSMKKALIFAVAGEALTLALVVAPSLVGGLLLGEQLSGVATPVARVAGIALIGLSVACWPGPPSLGMLTYLRP